MTLLLTDPPPLGAAPQQVPPVSPLSFCSAHTAWVFYQPDDKRQQLPDAFMDSISDHIRNHGVPTLALFHPANVDWLAPIAVQDLGMFAYTPVPGGVTVQAGTWGLA